MSEVNLLDRYPRSKRNIASRAVAVPREREVAKRFDWEYFDGQRTQGYGGYTYDGRWVPIARDIVAHFGLRAGHHVLDVGCAKGFLVKDLMLVCPGLRVYGLDVSEYALRSAEPEARGRLVRGTADQLPFRAGAFDVVLCINVIHNLDRPRCLTALREIERLAPGRGYVRVDAYRNEAEREIFLEWVLTAVTFLTPEAWRALLVEAGYTGDYSWTILEPDPDVNDFGRNGERPAVAGEQRP